MPKPVTAQIEYKNFRFELKSVDEEQGIIEGYLSTFDNVDEGNDRVNKGAFKKTLMDAKSRMQKGKQLLWPVLWIHEENQPLGKVLDAYEDGHGLYTKFWLDITRTDGQANNPLAVMVFSGYKNGYVDVQSMGYKVIQATRDRYGVRDLKEVQVWELSCVTSLFAMNEEAVVTSVKSMQTKSGDFPLADKTTPWSKSKAIRDIETATNGDWGSAANKYFFWNAASPSTEADHKFPFVANIGGSMKAVPRAIFNAAARLESAQGVDTDAIKAAMTPYYSKLGMSPPWSSANSDKGKSIMTGQQTPLEAKDFSDYYQMQAISDWADKWQSLTSALKSAVLDAFNIGDSPEDDVKAALNGGEGSPGFIDALMDWVDEGIGLNVSDYMKPDPYDSQQSQRVGFTALGYMSRNDALQVKKGAMVSKESAARLSGHADTLELAHKAIATVADDMRRYITGGQAPFNSDTGGDGEEEEGTTGNNSEGKSRRNRPRNAPVTNDQPPASTDLTGLSDAEIAEWALTAIELASNLR